MNARPALAFAAAAEFRASETGAPLKNIIDDNNSMIQNFEPNLDQ